MFTLKNVDYKMKEGLPSGLSTFILHPGVVGNSVSLFFVYLFTLLFLFLLYLYLHGQQSMTSLNWTEPMQG